jgi:sugar phosphate isomerase/epimerase
MKMRIGFLTACLGQMTLDQIIEFAARERFDDIDVAAWPSFYHSNPFVATHIDADAWTESQGLALRKHLSDAGVCISHTSFYANLIQHDDVMRGKYTEYLKRLIEVASSLEIPVVGTFIGRDVTRTVNENLLLLEERFIPLVRHAEKYGIILAVENCPMEGWDEFGLRGNIFYSPELWEAVFKRIDSKNFGIIYDPSHSIWLGIDPVWPISIIAPHLVGVHGKDTLIDREALRNYGFFGKQIERNSTWDIGWWQYVMPGLGEVDWPAILRALHQIGYHGTISIENEDMAWFSDTEKKLQGIILAKRHIEKSL